MKDDEDIETMFLRSQTLVPGLQVLNKSYTIPDHVNNIFRSLPVRYRPKVIAIQEVKDLNTPSLEILINNIQIHEIKHSGMNMLRSQSLLL